jgi:phenylpropionate dioxygenase-like ring-hydroxylating dioxygenase large terminal subunit
MANRPPLEARLTAPATKAKVSVTRCHDAWYVGCESKDLKSKPLKVTILGIPMVLFRASTGTPGALLDRCPHRNVPLSIGEVDGDILRCSYHGWEFATDGSCTHLPCFTGEPNTKGHAATAYPVREQQGFIWIYANADEEPTIEPFDIPLLDDSRYTHVYQIVEAPGTMHATIENALDVPHTAFLHRGLFRSAGAGNKIEVVVRRWNDRVEAQYIGEPRPEGLVGRLLAPGGGEVEHYDRFLLPSVAQVEYKIGDDSHILITSLCTPVGDFETKLSTIISFRLARLPEWVVGTLLKPIGKQIFKQDAKMLAQQTKLIERFGGEQFVSTEVDVLGGEIWRLLKAAERGDAAPNLEEPTVKRLTMEV